MRKTVAILGIPIDDLNMEQTLERLEQFVASGRFHQIATANTDFLVKAAADPELKAVLLSADLVVPDGMPLVMASHWLRAGLRERVTGADLVPRLAAISAKKGYRIYMLGGAHDVAERARRRLEEQNPGLHIVGCSSPPFGSIVQMDNEAILADIEAARPDILLVAFGNPKQEKWIYMHRRQLRVPVCIGVGGTFDFIAGSIARAPDWMQKTALEWLFRLLQEPRRLWRRYAKDLSQFARLIATQLWSMRRATEPLTARITDVRLQDWTIVSVNGPLDLRVLPDLQYAAERAFSIPTHLILDLSAATHLDSSVLGTLLNLPKRAGFVGREVRLIGLQGRVRQALRAGKSVEHLTVYPTVAEAIIGGLGNELEIDVMVEKERALVSLRGRAVADRAAELEAALASIPMQARYVGLDLRGVTYVECGLLASLHRFSDKQEAAGIEVRLAPSQAVARLIEAEKLAGFHVAVSPLRWEAPVTAGHA